MYIDSLKKEIGEAVYYTIIKATNELCSTGLYQKDEKQDLIHDFILLCLTTKNDANLTPQALIPYLVLCVRNHKLRLITIRKREKETFRSIYNPATGSDYEIYDSCSQQPLAHKVLEEDMNSAIEQLDEPACSIVKYLLETECTPSYACKVFGKSRMYYYRTILPELKKFF